MLGLSLSFRFLLLRGTVLSFYLSISSSYNNYIPNSLYNLFGHVTAFYEITFK